MSKARRAYAALPTDPDQHTDAAQNRYTRHILLSLSLLCNALLTFPWIMFALRTPNPFSFPEAGYSPAQHAIEYKTVKFHRGLHGDVPLYERPPSAEVDQAWEKLYAYAASRIPKSEADKLTNKTWPILHEDGKYVIALDVFHQLHCLDVIRQQLELPNGLNYTRRTPAHLRHCVGAIRQALMCTADTSPVVWQWSDKYKEAEQRDDILHTCRDFDRLQDWARERSMGLLPDLSVYVEEG
ncbi:hypothetical protein B0H11DRAFT_2230629 [Mycena galericulata]|nr:hypothetical protein B0H11DRAFT_2230629 [Mycena galericulata]